MMTKKFEEGNLPLSKAARDLIESAEKAAQEFIQSTTLVNDEAIEINIWHILLAALTDRAITTHHILKEITDENRHQSLISHVRNRIQKPEGSHRWSLDLYLQACAEIAREEHIQINDALILWQIIQKNLSVSSLFLSLGIDSRQLQQSLQEATSIHPSGESIPPLAIPEIWRNVKPIQLTQGLINFTSLRQINHHMHSVTMNYFVAALKSALTVQHNDVIIFGGANGSAIDLIEYLLAYWIGQTASILPSNPHISDLLKGYELWQVSLSRFRDLARRRRLPLNLLLNYLKQEAGLRKVILLLTDLESIQRDSAAGRKIKEQLSLPDNVCIVCFYVFSDTIKPDDDKEWHLGLENVIPVLAEQMDDKTQIYEFIRAHHLSRWAEQGYTVDDTTFDGLLELEKGIWIFRKRKTWPYLGIDLVDDCIDTAKKGPQSIRNLALDARVAINNVLTKEALRVGDALRAEFDPTLQAAKQRIEALCENQDLALKDGYRVISQSMIEAQLFCRNNSEFHYPGIRP